jgi:alpha-N-arabinofuranosidase
MKWCEAVGTEPYLCLNFGTGTLDEALGWLEYCNSDRNTYYANLRRKNGREKPYNVWAITHPRPSNNPWLTHFRR